MATAESMQLFVQIMRFNASICIRHQLLAKVLLYSHNKQCVSTHNILYSALQNVYIHPTECYPPYVVKFEKWDDIVVGTEVRYPKMLQEHPILLDLGAKCIGNDAAQIIFEYIYTKRNELLLCR